MPVESGMFLHHHGVRASGHDGTGHDPDRLPGSDRSLIGNSGERRSRQTELDGAFGRKVVTTKRVPIHSRIGMARNRPGRDDRIRKDTPDGMSQGHPLYPRHSGYCRQHVSQRLVNRDADSVQVAATRRFVHW
jgi:hypothetical protein